MTIHKEVLEDIANECTPQIFQEMILHSGLSDRQLVQTACVWKFKYEVSQREQHDIGWSLAWKIWVEQGYASQFDIHYHQERKWGDVYQLVIANRTCPKDL